MSYDTMCRDEGPGLYIESWALTEDVDGFDDE